MKKKTGIILFVMIIVIVLLFGETIISYCFQQYRRMVEDANLLPEHGTYYCAELETSIVFDGRISYHYADGSSETLLQPIGDGADFDGESGNFTASYHWDQDRDLLVIHFSQYPSEIPKSSSYEFCKIK